MPTPDRTYALAARWLIAVDRPPIEGGVLTVSGRKIVAVGENVSGNPAIDLGDAIVLPGLVNAHTHLEFSGLKAPLGHPGIALVDWIRLVIEYRRRASGDVRSAVLFGLSESMLSGVTSVGEIATGDTIDATFADPAWASRFVSSTPLDVTVFLELIGLGEQRVAEMVQIAGNHRALTWPENWRGALSPHAPYSASPKLVAAAARLCASPASPPVAMHLAESREEIDFLSTGAGPFRMLLEDLGAWQDDVVPTGSRPLDYLRLLGEANRAVVIHGNYLSDEEIDFLSRHCRQFSVVYCPRTHDFFRHDPYPLEKLLSAGVNVALGTDSRASNPDLDVLAELRFVAAAYPQIPAETILRLATINGAVALGRESNVGTLTPGKDANLTILSAPQGRRDDPYRAILDSTAQVRSTIVQGVATDLLLVGLRRLERL
jgi:cytosine/adenosine deaminase-related metal-dependent hydrolase